MMHRFGHHWIYGHPWMYGPPPGDGFVWWPGMLLTVLSILFLVALFIGLVWTLLRWIIPSISPLLTNFIGVPQAYPSALEILRRRYAAGEIDAVTFEHMWERLVASYQQIGKEVPDLDYYYQEERWTGYGGYSTPPATYGQGKVGMAELEHYRSENDK